MEAQFSNIFSPLSSPADVTRAAPGATLPGFEDEDRRHIGDVTVTNISQCAGSCRDSFEWCIEQLLLAGGVSVVFQGVDVQGDWCSMFMGYFRNNGDI